MFGSLETLTPLGAVVLAIIVLMSVAALGVALERVRALWIQRRNMALGSERLIALLRDGQRATAEHLNTSLPWHPAVPVFDLLLRDEVVPATQVKREQQRAIRASKLRLWLVGTIGATAPFVGLFGTVLGVMDAFNAIGEQGAGGFAVVSSGISEALITTAGGIAVGVEAMFLFNLLQVRTALFAAELREACEELAEAVASAPATPAAPKD